MTLLRRALGETLRGQRLSQRRTLREVSGAARVSLGYLSEVERGQKEASSELLASICDALDVRLSEVLREVSDTMRRTERAGDAVRAPARQLVPAGVAVPINGARTAATLPIGRDSADLPVDLDLPSEFDRAALVDRVGVDRVGRDSPAELAADTRHDPGSFDPGSFDPGSFDPGSFDPGSFGPDSLDAERLATVDAKLLEPDRRELTRRVPDHRELERIGLDGVDLAELETGDGFADADALLSLTDLSCCLERRPHDVTACLPGEAVAA